MLWITATSFKHSFHSLAYQTHCPQWGHLLFSDHYMECMLQSVRKGIGFTITNIHERSTEVNVMSSAMFCGRILSAPRQTGICMMLRLLKWIRQENSQKFISWDSVTNMMSGVITMMKEITFPLFAWKKCFSLRKVRWRIEATYFTGDCIIASRESCGPAEKMTPRCA